jgi:Na+/melibiose symporter-like transporter
MKPAWLLLADILSYLPLVSVLVVLLWITEKIEPVSGEQQAQEAPAEKLRLLDALQYAWQERTLRVVLLVQGCMVVLTSNGEIVNPLMADQVFHLPSSYGLLIASQGAGQVLSSFLVAGKNKKSDSYWMHQMLLWGGINCVCLIGYGSSRWFPIGLAMMGLVGATVAPYLSAVELLTQTIPEDKMTGRIIGLKEGLSGVDGVLGKLLTGGLITICGVGATTSIESAAALVFIVGISAIRQRTRRSK